MMNDDMRIKYKRGEHAAWIDKTIFTRWVDGLITTERARMELEDSVEHRVSTTQFLVNANELGYRKKGKGE